MKWRFSKSDPMVSTNRALLNPKDLLCPHVYQWEDLPFEEQHSVLTLGCTSVCSLKTGDNNSQLALSLHGTNSHNTPCG